MDFTGTCRKASWCRGGEWRTMYNPAPLVRIFTGRLPGRSRVGRIETLYRRHRCCPAPWLCNSYVPRRRVKRYLTAGPQCLRNADPELPPHLSNITSLATIASTVNRLNNIQRHDMIDKCACNTAVSLPGLVDEADVDIVILKPIVR